MPEEYFKKCIDELAEYCYKGIVGLWINNEPLLDKRIVKFVEYAAKRLPEADVKIITNGLLLTPRTW
jgi:MoaA/NifB/PqqE/SkfB family radical SAM enzyme